MADETSIQDPVEVQDFANPFDKFKRNPNRDDIFKQIQRKKAEQEIITASKSNATKKEKIAARKSLPATLAKPSDKLRSGQVWKYIEDIAPTFKYIEPDPDQVAELEAKQLAAEWNQEDAIKQTAKDFDKSIEAPNIKFGGYGEEIPGSGMFITSVTRGLMQAGAAVTDEFAKVLQSATNTQIQIAQDNMTLYPELYANGEKPSEIKNPIGEFGEWLSKETELAKQITAQMGGDKAKRPVIQRVGEVVGGLGGRLPSMLLIAEAGGPIVGFGTMQAMQARARGVTDPKELAMEFTWGAIKGKVFNSVGKSAEWMEKAGIAKQGGSFFATGAQSTAQFITGVGEQAIEAGLHPNQEKPDAFDYLSAGLTNTLLDPILVPGGTKKAQGAIETIRKFEGANLTVPEVSRKYLDKDFFMEDYPIENKVTFDLLKKAKVQYVPEQDVLWVNPAAGVVLGRAAAALGKSKLADADGLVYTTKQVGDLINLLSEKSVQVQEMIREMDEPTADANKLAESAILYESLAEHLATATEGKDKLTVRFAGKEENDLPVIGHEKIHESQMTVAREVGSSIYDLQNPNFLLEHPIGAKFISEHGDILDEYKAHQWTAETMAYVAQPGNNIIKLSVEERGILFGDYLADIANRHGSKSLSKFDVTWADREVARNAFTRLAQRNYVELKKDKGIPVGLIWKQGDYFPINYQGSKLVNGGEVQPPMIIGDRIKLNQAIKANDLLWRLKESKARHDDGELIRVYHGSPQGLEIKEVDLTRLNKGDWLKGLFTTQEAATASKYATRGGFGSAAAADAGSNVHKFYLDIKNPLDLDAEVEIKPNGDLAIYEAYSKAVEIESQFMEGLAAKYGTDNIESLVAAGKFDPADYEQGLALTKASTEAYDKYRESRKSNLQLSMEKELGVKIDYVIDGNTRGLIETFKDAVEENDPASYVDAPEFIKVKAAYDEINAKATNLFSERNRVGKERDLLNYASYRVDDIVKLLKDKYAKFTVSEIEPDVETYIRTRGNKTQTYTSGPVEVEPIRMVFDKMVELTGKGNRATIEDILTQADNTRKYYEDEKKTVTDRYSKLHQEYVQVGSDLNLASLELNAYKINNSVLPIDLIHKALLNMGYDGATHIGGGNFGEPKTFTNKAEAENYAKEVGGTVNERVRSKQKLLPQESLDIESEAYKAIAKQLELTQGQPATIDDVYQELLTVYGSLPENGFIPPWLKDANIGVLLTQLGAGTQYFVDGHKVWIAFKPEQVISATDVYPVVEPFIDNVEYQKQKLQWEKNRIAYEAKRQELLNEAQSTLVDWKQNEAARLLSEWKIEYSDKAPIDDPRAFDMWIDGMFGDMVKVDDDFDVPLSIKTPPEPADESANGKTEIKDALEQFYLIEEEYKDVTRQHNAKGAHIREAAKTSRYLYKLKNSGVDVTDALTNISNDIVRLQNEKKQLADEKVKLRNLLRESWVPIADDYKKAVDLSINSELEEGTKRYLNAVDKATQKVKEINEDPEKLNLTWKEGLDQNIIKLVNFKRIGEFGADIMKSLGLEVLPTSEKSFHRQLMEAVNLGAIDVDNFNSALAKYGMSLSEMVDSFLYAGSEAGRILNTLKVIKADLSKMMKDSPETLGPNLQKLYSEIPELQMWFENNTPTMKEIKSLVKGRNNVMRFISTNNGAALLTMATQATNFVISSAKLLGKGFENYLEAVENRIRTGHYDSLLPNGEIEQKDFKPNTVADSFRPVFEIAGILNYVTGVDKSHSIGRYITSLKQGVKWMDEGVVPVGRPSTRGERAIDIITQVQKVFPKTYDQLFASLNGDFESMDIPLLEQTLNTMKRQLELSPDSPMKEKKLKELTIQQTKLAKEGGRIAKALRGGEYAVHKLMLLGRGPERVLRTAAFVGQLDYYAKRYGQDIQQLATDGRLNEVHPDALTRATNDALEITYGVQPKNNFDGSVESMYASYLRFLRAGDNPASIALNIIQPYQNFVVQATKEAFNWSPLAILRYYKLFTDTKSTLIADGDYRQFNKFFMGTLAYTFFQMRANEKYDEAERTKQPPPNPSWDDLGGFSMKGTPLGPMMFVADTIARYNRGLPMSEKNWVRALGNLAVDFRGVTGIFDWMDGFWERFSKGSDKIGDDLKNELSLQIGQWMSKFATPLRNYSDFAGEIDKDQRTLKDIYGWGYGNLFTPTLDKLPSSFIKPDGTRMHLRDLLYDRIDSYTGRPMMRNHPAARALTGFNLIPEQSKLNKLMVMQGISYSDWIPYSGIPEVDRELIKNVVKFTPELAKKYEEGAMDKLHVDQQTSLIMEILKEYSAEALDMTLVNFPDVRQKMEDNQELNKWERRVFDRNMKAKTGKTFSDIYESLKAKRRTTEKMLDMQRTLDIDMTGKGTWTIKE